MRKVTSLYPKKAEKIPSNMFERELFEQNHRTYSGNGSVKLTTSGNVFVDDFANLGNYKTPRQYEDVAETMRNLWTNDPLTTLKESFYIRLITRQPITLKGEKLSTHRGQGLKSEFWHRMLWLAQNHPGTFAKNVSLIPVIGSWDDLFEILRLDLQYNGIDNKSFDWTPILNLILTGLEDQSQVNLIKKYLPTIHSAKNCTTLRKQCNAYIGKMIANYLFAYTSQPLTEKEKATVYAAYRKMKSSGTAHSWQQLISKKQFDRIDFNKVAGRALQKLTNSKFLENHNLEDAYAKWIASQPVAKYTGYVYELFKPVCIVGGWGGNRTRTLKKYQEDLLNKQFAGLIETAKKDMNRESNFIGVLDISGSMTAEALGTGMSSYQVGLAMCLYFSHLLEGRFKDTFLTFSSNVEIHKFEGKTPLDKFRGFSNEYYGSTDFLGVARLLCSLKLKGYDESEFPTGILCLSDGEFDYSGRNSSTFNKFKELLLKAGFSKEFVDNFKIVLWDIRNGYYGDRKKATFESLADAPNFFYMSGLDPAGIAFLTGTTKMQSIPKTAEELFEAAMTQELFEQIRL